MSAPRRVRSREPTPRAVSACGTGRRSIRVSRPRAPTARRANSRKASSWSTSNPAISRSSGGASSPGYVGKMARVWVVMGSKAPRRSDHASVATPSARATASCSTAGSPPGSGAVTRHGRHHGADTCPGLSRSTSSLRRCSPSDRPDDRRASLPRPRPGTPSPTGCRDRPRGRTPSRAVRRPVSCRARPCVQSSHDQTVCRGVGPSRSVGGSGGELSQPSSHVEVNEARENDVGAGGSRAPAATKPCGHGHAQGSPACAARTSAG